MLYEIKIEHVAKISDILSKIGAIACYFSCTVRSEQNNDEIQEVLRRMNMYIDDVKVGLWWPGTELWSDETIAINEGIAYTYIYNLNKILERKIVSICDNVFDWRYPFLPEDIAFYNKKKREIFWSVAHHKVAGCILDDDEMKIIGENLKYEVIKEEDLEMIGRFSE